MLSKGITEKTGTRKILVVDDEKDVLLVLQRSLAAEGYSVITAENGRDAIISAASEHPDLILLDSVMPNMHGQTVLTKLKASRKTKNIPVIMVTALAGEDDINRAQKSGATDYVVKPFDYDVLLEKIAQALKSGTKREVLISGK